MGLSPNSRLGRYEIIAAIGAGGMGEVYRARDTRLQREVAIKILPADVARDAVRIRRFEQEAQAASALNHPNILTVHDSGIEDGIAYIVTELLNGQTLRDAITRGAVPPDRAGSVGIQLARGLAAAHQAGIVHRDLKPENIFITQDGTCKILDFGLARMDRTELSAQGTSAPTTGGTLAGTVMGTTGYMAPEQVRGQRADARSDLFSLGVIMHEMLAGESPFRRASVVESMNAILKEDAPGLPRATPFDSIVRRCLEKDPARRFQSASDLAFALENTSGEYEPSSSARGARVRSKMPAAFAISVVAVLMVAAILWVRNREQAPSNTSSSAPIRSLAVLPFTTLSQQDSDEYFSAGMTDALTAELSHVAALTVIGSRSAARFADTSRPRADIAKELGVEGLVSGSVLRAGDRVRISAQLSEAATDRVLWAENYERPVSDVLALQGDVTRAIAKAIALELSPADEKRLSASASVDPRALDEYLRGRYLWSQRTEESVRAALDHFHQSAQIAPDFALAYCGIADSYLMLGAYNYMQPRQAVPIALEALARVIAIDSTVAEAHATRGDLVLHYQRNYALSLRELDRAVALNPGYAPAHNWRSEVLLVLGRADEAIAEMERAITLDPLTPFPHFFLGLAYEAKGDAVKAEEIYRAAIKMSRGFPSTAFYTRLLLRQGRGDEAYVVAQDLVAANPSPENVAALGVVEALTGRREEALANLARLQTMSRQRWVSPFDTASLHAALGNREDALRHLGDAIEVRDFRIPFYLISWGREFDSLKQDPEFRKLIDIIGQPASL